MRDNLGNADKAVTRDVVSFIPGQTVFGLVQDLLFPKETVLDRVRLQIAILELERLRGKQGPVVSMALPDLLFGQEESRQDWIIVGLRGSGKTACACAIAQELAGEYEQRVYAVGWKEHTAKKLGFLALKKGEVSSVRDAIVIVDEGGLHWSPKQLPRKMVDLLATARHKDVSVVWNSQNLAQLDRNVLRFDAKYAFKRLDPVVSMFDREEAAPMFLDVMGIQARYQEMFDNKETLLVRVGDEWYLSGNPLPSGWTEGVSKLWR